MKKLQNKFLIATPSIEEDTVFHRSLVYIDSHDDDHATGFIVNKYSDITLRDLFDRQFKGASIEFDEIDSSLLDERLLIGGPVDPTSFFCLHEEFIEETELGLLGGEPELKVARGLNILRKLANGTMAQRCINLHGRSEWGPGQLEREFLDDSWIIADSVLDVIFDKQVGNRALLAAKHIGVDLNMMVRSLR